MPTRKELVRRALSFENVRPVPYWVTFTPGACKKLQEYLKKDDLEEFLGNYAAAAVTNSCHGVMPRNLTGDTWVDDFGVVWKGAGVDRGSPLEHPLGDAASLRNYTFPDPDDPRRFDHLDRFLKDNADRFIAVSLDFGLLFERAWYLRGMTEFLMDLHLNPGFAEDLLDHLVRYYIRSIANLSAFKGIDAVYLVDDYGIQQGLVMSPEMWRRFIKPRLAVIVGALKERGLVAHLHSCGNVSEIVADFTEIGVNVLDPLQPEAMDVRDIKKRYGGRLALMGGFSAQKIIPHGTRSEVRKHIEDCLRTLGNGGGYIASNSIPLQTDVPLENVLEIMRVLKNQL